VAESVDLQQELEAAMRQSVQASASASQDVSLLFQDAERKLDSSIKAENGCIPKHWQTWSLFGTGLSLADVGTADVCRS